MTKLWSVAVVYILTCTVNHVQVIYWWFVDLASLCIYIDRILLSGLKSVTLEVADLKSRPLLDPL